MKAVTRRARAGWLWGSGPVLSLPAAALSSPCLLCGIATHTAAPSMASLISHRFNLCTPLTAAPLRSSKACLSGCQRRWRSATRQPPPRPRCALLTTGKQGGGGGAPGRRRDCPLQQRKACSSRWRRAATPSHPFLWFWNTLALFPCACFPPPPRAGTISCRWPAARRSAVTSQCWALCWRRGRPCARACQRCV